MRPQAAGGGAATRRRTVPNGLFRKSYPANPDARTFVSATTRITQAQADPPPRVDSRLALRRPLELRLPRSAPVSGHETPDRTAPESQSHAPAVHPAQPRDLSSQNSSRDRPNRPNHIQHRDQQDPNDPGLEIREVGLGRVVAQQFVAESIQFLAQLRPRQRRPTNVRVGHLDVYPSARRLSRPLKNSRAARTRPCIGHTNATPPRLPPRAGIPRNRNAPCHPHRPARSHLSLLVCSRSLGFARVTVNGPGQTDHSMVVGDR